MQNKKSRIYSKADFEAAEPLDQLYMYLCQPDDFIYYLTQTQLNKIEALRSTWSIMCSKMSSWRRTKMIMAALMVSERTAMRYMEEASRLFGDILKTDAVIEMTILRDKYFSLAERAELAGDFDVARRCYDSAAAIISKIEARQPVQKQVFAAVIFTNDPKALTSRTEDADYEEENILELEAAPVPAIHAAN